MCVVCTLMQCNEWQRQRQKQQQTVDVNSFLLLLLLLLLLSLPPPLPTACCCSALICLWLCYLACSAARNKLTASVWVFVHTRAHVWVFRLAFVLVYEQTSRQQAASSKQRQRQQSSRQASSWADFSFILTVAAFGCRRVYGALTECPLKPTKPSFYSKTRAKEKKHRKSEERESNVSFRSSF